MSNYAKIDENNIVQEVVHFDDETEASGGPSIELPTGWRWIQTSFTNRIRTRFASKGMYYDSNHDAFIHPKPYSSWTLNTETLDWEAPVTQPTDYIDYKWNEELQEWQSDSKNQGLPAPTTPSGV